MIAMRSSIAAFCVALLLVVPVRSTAQPAPAGVLHITVVDATGAVIVGATVSATGIEAATRTVPPPPPAQTSPQGIALIPRLVPGRYSAQGTTGR
jgi:hypothetical protein